MKKIFTTVCVVLCFYTITKAQTKNVEFGVNVGFNGAYVTASGSNQTSNAVGGFNAGVSADKYFSDAWSLKVRVSYDQKGWGNGYITTPDGTTTYGVNYKLNYITLPVTANWHFGRTRNWYLDFGPYVGFLMNAKETNDNIDIKDAFNTTDGGIALGIGVKIPISNNAKFFIEYDGQGGATNIFKQTDDGSSIQMLRESINIGINF